MSIRKEVRDLAKRGNITPYEWDKIHKSLDGLNSWEKEALIPAMNSYLLIKQIDFTLRNCARRRHPAIVYEESLQVEAEAAVKLIRRLREANRAMRKALDYIVMNGGVAAERRIAKEALSKHAPKHDWKRQKDGTYRCSICRTWMGGMLRYKNEPCEKAAGRI